jgi:hypothetical protein
MSFVQSFILNYLSRIATSHWTILVIIRCDNYQLKLNPLIFLSVSIA